MLLTSSKTEECERKANAANRLRQHNSYQGDREGSSERPLRSDYKRDGQRTKEQAPEQPYLKAPEPAKDKSPKTIRRRGRCMPPLGE
jgi:hypothetical protein